MLPHACTHPTLHMYPFPHCAGQNPPIHLLLVMHHVPRDSGHHLAAGTLTAAFGDCDHVTTPPRVIVDAAPTVGVFAGDLRGEVISNVAEATATEGLVVAGAGKLLVLEADSGRAVVVVEIGSENEATGTKLTSSSAVELLGTVEAGEEAKNQ